MALNLSLNFEFRNNNKITHSPSPYLKKKLEQEDKTRIEPWDTILTFASIKKQTV